MGEAACVMQPVPVIPTEAFKGDPLWGLNDSVSFGRFVPESLSWEKWSTFSHKKYVEEAERYSKPGSVAEKKAFFEAHYKKMASMKASALLEQANNDGLDSVTVPSKSQDTGKEELKDHTKKDNILSNGGLDLESKEEKNVTRKDEGGSGFAPETIKLNELGRNTCEQKQDVQMETPPPKDLASSPTSLSLDRPLQKKRISFVKFMCGSRSRPKTTERVQKRKENKAETKSRNWNSCFCFGAGQLEDRRSSTRMRLRLFPRSPSTEEDGTRTFNNIVSNHGGSNLKDTECFGQILLVPTREQISGSIRSMHG